MGNDIQESSVPFDIDRNLTEAEIAETVKYCHHDVEQTIEVFLNRLEEFDTMFYFMKHFHFPIRDISKTKPQLAAKMLGGNGKGKDFNDEFKFPILNLSLIHIYVEFDIKKRNNAVHVVVTFSHEYYWCY